MLSVEENLEQHPRAMESAMSDPHGVGVGRIDLPDSLSSRSGPGASRYLPRRHRGTARSGSETEELGREREKQSGWRAPRREPGGAPSTRRTPGLTPRGSPAGLFLRL